MNARRDEESALVSVFRQLSDDDPQLVRIFQRGETEWGALGADAERVAQMVYRTSSALRKIGNAQLPLCTMNTTLFRSFLADALQKHGLRIEVYENEPGSRTRWQRAKRASPGNLQAVEDLLGQSANQRPVVCAIHASGTSTKSVGVCFVDAESRDLGLAQFSDNDLFSNVESLVIQLGVKEALLVDDNSPDTRKLAAVMAKLDVLTTQRKSSQFSSTDVDQDLVRLTGKSELDLARELQLTQAVGAAGAAIRYLGLLAVESNFGQFILREHNLDQYMRLDASALKALNVMPTSRDGAKTMSLYGLLNQCRTVAGSRTLAQWLKQPLMDLAEIEERHNLVGTFIQDPAARSRLQDDCFGSVPDLSKIARKFYGGKAKLDDVVRVYQLVIKLPDFIDVLTPLGDGCVSAYVGPLQEASEQLAKLVELVETTVDLQALQNHEYVVKADFDEHLKSLKDQMQQAWTGMESCHEQAMRDLGTDKVKMENNTSYGWAFRLTRTDAGCLRGRREFIELGTQKAGQYFTTVEMRQQTTAYANLGGEYRKAQFGVAREVVNIASTYLPVLQPLAETLAHLDVIVSFARVSAFAKLPYVRPRMSLDGPIRLTAARHPCMEVQPDMMFIPNDVELNRNGFAIITGPNMGGKSTYIRQVGVVAHMAQIGCFVPCTEAELPVVDCILARVGAGDSQLKGISTFMAEMLETASILKTATSRSLIVIDELGRGTSTYDGFGLAWAIAQHIVEHIGSFCLFATHFHELTALGDRYPDRVVNLHVVADARTDDDITLLYLVQPGISDKSFGIHVAEVVHFPDKVVRMAKRKAAELEAADAPPEGADDELRELLKGWANKSRNADPDAAISSLRELVAAERPKLETNAYLRGLLADL